VSVRVLIEGVVFCENSSIDADRLTGRQLHTRVAAFCRESGDSVTLAMQTAPDLRNAYALLLLNASMHPGKAWRQIIQQKYLIKIRRSSALKIFNGFHHPSIHPSTQMRIYSTPCTFAIPAVAPMNFNAILSHCSCRVLLLLLLLPIAAMQEWSCQMAARLPPI